MKKLSFILMCSAFLSGCYQKPVDTSQVDSAIQTAQAIQQTSTEILTTVGTQVKAREPSAKAFMISTGETAEEASHVAASSLTYVGESATAAGDATKSALTAVGNTVLTLKGASAPESASGERSK